MSAHCPYRCTGMMTFVRGVIAAESRSALTLKVSGSMSTKTGRPPRRETTPADAKKLNGLVMTSSPGPTPSAISATKSASVPEETPSACRTPIRSANAFSNWVLTAPRMNRPDENTPSTPQAIARFSSSSYRVRSRRGTGWSGFTARILRAKKRAGCAHARAGRWRAEVQRKRFPGPEQAPFSRCALKFAS